MDMRISDLITERILELLNESDESTAEIQRNEFANGIGCAPSQINYVLSSRFTPEHGFIIESRRGGGGYIRIRRVVLDSSSAIMHIINSVGDEIDSMSAHILIDNCYQSGLIDKHSARLMDSAISKNVMHTLPPAIRNAVRASIIKEMLLVQL